MGSERADEFSGWGSALKPAREDRLLMRKPLDKGLSIAENCLKWGTGGIDIDESRINYNGEIPNIGGRGNHGRGKGYGFKPMNNLPKAGKRTKTFGSDSEPISGGEKDLGWEANQVGRFPANLLHDGSDEVRECFPETKSGNLKPGHGGKRWSENGWGNNGSNPLKDYGGDSGNASRFFKSIIYQAKASKSERQKGCEDLYILKDNTPREDIEEIKRLLSI